MKYAFQIFGNQFSIRKALFIFIVGFTALFLHRSLVHFSSKLMPKEHLDLY